jgi:hypothetical protein
MTSSKKTPNGKKESSDRGWGFLRIWNLELFWSLSVVIWSFSPGCGQKQEDPLAMAPPFAITQGKPSNAPLDAAPSANQMFHVEVFVLSAPSGTFSRNDEFWKRIDEQCLDVGTYELLQKNGMRVGVAPLAELQQISPFLVDATPVQKFAVTGAELKDVQIDMKVGVQAQTIFYFDRQNHPVGRSFDKSENVMNVSFKPAPRKPGHLRMEFCPMVRAMRKKMQFTAMNESYEIQFVNPEVYYDLNFLVDIPADSFLIVTPSEAASFPSRLGRAFMIKDTPTSQLEQMLLIVPQPIEKGKPRSAPAAPQIKK